MLGSVRSIFASRRGALWTAFLFTGVINILMLATPLYSMQVFSTVVPTGSLETLASLTLMAVAATMVMSALELVRDRVLYKAGLWLDFNLQGYILERWLRLGPSQGADIRTEGKLAAAIKAYATGPAINPLFDAPWAPIFLVGLFVLHPLLGLVGLTTAVLLALAAIAQAFATDGPQTEAAKAQELTDRWWQSVAVDSARLNGAGLAPIARDRWEMLAEESAHRAYALHCRSSTIKIFAKCVRMLAQCAIFAAGALVVIKNEANAGVLIASSIMLGKALAPFEQSVALLKLFFMANAASRALSSLTRPPVAEVFDADAGTMTGRLTVQDATYAYPGRTQLALRGINIELSPGESLGLIGPNGAGKSTLSALIAGAIEPRSGSVDIDGLGTARWQRGLERPCIGFVGSHPALFDGTVHENIVRFGDLSLMSASQAAMKIGVHDILSDLPQGYETKITADGTGLSARESRAVCFARAVHGKPRLLILDEPELGLDGAAEKRLIAVLAELKKAGVMLVIATQQPRLLTLTDKVAVLKKGSVEMFGPAAEVMQKLQGGGPPAKASAGPSTSRPAAGAVATETSLPRPATAPRAPAATATSA